MDGADASKAGINDFARLLICAHRGLIFFFKERIAHALSLLKGRGEIA
jgi:hypothetical protein